MDVHTPRQRSFNMSRIRGKDTKPELLLRRLLWQRGYRYRLHRKDLPGKPDIVLSRYHAAVFIHGCFWHQHSGCRYATMPATRKEFWTTKLGGNVERDRMNVSKLQTDGWRVVVVWECALKKRTELQKVVSEFEKWLHSGQPYIELGAD